MSQYIPQLAILLAMDWLIGMFRTITNIWGDACAVSCVDHWANKCAPIYSSCIPVIPPLDSGLGLGKKRCLPYLARTGLTVGPQYVGTNFSIPLHCFSIPPILFCNLPFWTGT